MNSDFVGYHNRPDGTSFHVFKSGEPPEKPRFYWWIREPYDSVPGGSMPKSRAHGTYDTGKSAYDAAMRSTGNGEDND